MKLSKKESRELSAIDVAQKEEGLRLSAHNIRDFREGLEFRSKLNALHGQVRQDQEDQAELDLALRWFRNWWEQRYETAARRKRVREREKR